MVTYKGTADATSNTQPNALPGVPGPRRQQAVSSTVVATNPGVTTLGLASMRPRSHRGGAAFHMHLFWLLRWVAFSNEKIADIVERDAGSGKAETTRGLFQGRRRDLRPHLLGSPRKRERIRGLDRLGAGGRRARAGRVHEPGDRAASRAH